MNRSFSVTTAIPHPQLQGQVIELKGLIKYECIACLFFNGNNAFVQTTYGQIMQLSKYEDAANITFLFNGTSK